MNEIKLSPVFCLHNETVLLEQNQRFVKIAMVDDSNSELKERLERCAARNGERKVVFEKISRDEFTKKISSLFTRQNGRTSSTEENQQEVYDENAAKAILKSLVSQARALDATDIHIEDSRVRFRVRGKLSNEISIDSANEFSLVQRIKLLSKMNVVEKRRGQDGQFVFTEDNGKNIFVRVSCLPSVKKDESAFGESVVLRLLDTERIALELDSLGFAKQQLNSVKKMTELKDGLVLICGPTGSGKSTTACSMLEEIRRNSCNAKKIISLEDPPEYVLEGVTQVQINSEYGMDFSDVLRRTFRQDPDVIFVGEIRDGETARIAVQAALTGHLVFATLHTASISQAVIRLCDLGEEPGIVHEVLRGIIVQHLENGKLIADVRYMGESIYKKIKFENAGFTSGRKMNAV